MPQDVGAAAFQYMKDACGDSECFGSALQEAASTAALPRDLQSHLMWHLGFSCQYFNPRCGCNHKDESFVGRVAKVANSW